MATKAKPSAFQQGCGCLFLLVVLGGIVAAIANVHSALSPAAKPFAVPATATTQRPPSVPQLPALPVPARSTAKQPAHLLTASDLAEVPAIGDTETEFRRRFGPPHLASDNQWQWAPCPGGETYQLAALFQQSNLRAVTIWRTYCATIPSANAQFKEARAFLPPDAVEIGHPAPGSPPGVKVYRSGIVADEISDPTWRWGGTPGAFQVQPDDQGGQWIIMMGQ